MVISCKKKNIHGGVSEVSSMVSKQYFIDMRNKYKVVKCN